MANLSKNNFSIYRYMFRIAQLGEQTIKFFLCRQFKSVSEQKYETPFLEYVYKHK